MEPDDRAGAEMYQIASALAALGHKLRLKVWCILMPHGSRGLSARSIAAQLAVRPSLLSFHLQQMTQAGVLCQRRSSHQTIYAVHQDVVARSCGLLLSGAGDRIAHRCPGRRSLPDLTC